MKKKITSVLLVMLACLMLSIPVFTTNASAVEISVDEIGTDEINIDAIGTDKINLDEINSNEVSSYEPNSYDIGTNEVSSNDKLPRLVDKEDLLTAGEEAYLIDRLDEVSEAHRCDIVILTIDDIGTSTPTAYADDFFDYNGYGYGDSHDGILLLVSLNTRDWAISTTGKAIQVFTDAGLSHIESQFKPPLSDGNYAKSFNIFVDCCEKFLIQAENGAPYDVDNMPVKPLSIYFIPLAIIIGAVISFIVVNIMKSSLKSVSKQLSATNYVRNGSMRITNQHDNYVYRKVNKIRRDTNNSSSGSRSRGGSRTHRSSSGRRHGGSSGKF